MIQKEREGVTLSGLVNQYRIERAKWLLESQSGLSILEIAFEAGFQSKSTFNALFKKWTGMNPREYRSREYCSSSKVKPLSET